MKWRLNLWKFYEKSCFTLGLNVINGIIGEGLKCVSHVLDKNMPSILLVAKSLVEG